MDWIPLIASTLRLVDIHDSDREPGIAQSRYNLYREARPGRKDGLWLDVAINILEYLREQEGVAVGGFVSGAEIREIVKENVQALTDEDIAFVLSALTVPAEIWYVEPMSNGSRPLKSSKDTNLVERSRTADAYRLANSGKVATTLAASVKDIAYIAGSAKNLLTAIKARDFWKLTELSASMNDSLRSFRLEIETRREAGQRDELQAFFHDRGAIIQEQIQEAVQILREADEFLNLESTRAEFEKWIADMDKIGKPSFGHGYAIEQVRRVAGQTLKLLNSFAVLIGMSISADESALQPISFLALSSYLAAQDNPENFYMTFLRSYGPTRFCKSFPCPFDYKGIVEPEHATDKSDIDADEQSADDRETKGIAFIEEHRQVIIDALKAGPLPLGEAFSKGWIVFDSNEIENADGLISLYCDPSMLGADMKVSVRLSDDRISFDCGNHTSLVFNNLEMVMER